MLKKVWVGGMVNLMFNSYEQEVKLPLAGQNGPNAIKEPHFRGAVQCVIKSETSDSLVVDYFVASFYAGGVIKTSKQYTYRLVEGEIHESFQPIEKAEWLENIKSVEDLDAIAVA